MTRMSADRKGQTRIALIHTNVQQIRAIGVISVSTGLGLKLGLYLIAQ